MQTRIIPPTPGAYVYPLLIKRLLMSGSRYEQAREIVYRDKLRYSYKTLAQRIARLANVLTEAGVQAGDTVAVMDWDSHRYLECMFAIPMIGAVVHTINVRLSPEQILYTMNHAEDRYVLVNTDFVPLYQSISGQLTTVRNTILLTDNDNHQADLPGLIGEYETLLAAASAEYAFPDFDENSVATTFYTTGTTGNPKGVYFTHRQLVLHTLSLSTMLGSIDCVRLMGTSDVYMPITPMFHVHAWGVPYAATMLGIKQVYPGRYEPEMLLQLWQNEQVTFSHCVPTILQMLLNCEGGRGMDFAGWRIIIGGSALNRALYDAALARGIQLTAAYGMSETCPMISCAYFDQELMAADAEARANFRLKAGVPVPLVEAAVLDAAGSALPANGESQGELVLRAPWLSMGYLNEPERSEELWDGGWLHTGDVATLDHHGAIDIRDRIKDVIKTGGEWISSLELEGLIALHPAVREVAVVGVPDAQWGERPFALVVPRDQAPPAVALAAAIKAHLLPYVSQGQINKWAVPSQLAVVEQIPKTSVGKLDKKRIRADIIRWQGEGDLGIVTL